VTLSLFVAFKEAVFVLAYNVQGCYGPLSRWLVRVINKMTAMVFATVCIQVCTCHSQVSRNGCLFAAAWESNTQGRNHI